MNTPTLIKKSFKAFGILFVITTLLIGIILNSKAHALSSSQFNPGNLIDDAIFNNYSSMSTQEIQAFLNSKVPDCDTNGQKQYYSSGMTRAQWAQASGKPQPPYICLKDYSQTIPAVTNGGSDLCKKSISSGTKSAAQIIKDAAVACEINPQVLIVMLQKEQSLVTDDWPWPSQYDKAMGYACPDSGPNNSANCDSAYFGFFNQVYNAAKAFRRYESNPDSYNYKANRNNYILYNPNTACGGSSVYIENQATANLYIYTPYQPNTAALNNLYGTGDGCSAYGNRNFWRMFNDWFGSTHGSVHAWDIVSQYAYADSSKTTSVNLNDVRPGQKIFVGIKAKNVGNVNWGNSGNYPVMAGTTGPPDRNSKFCSTGWLSCSRPTLLKESVVAPNQIGTFEFWIEAPNDAGTYTENFSLLVHNYKWMNDLGMNFKVRVSSGQNYDWQVKSLEYFKDSTKKVKVDPASIKASDKFYTKLIIKNIGLNDWVNDNDTPIRLGATSGTGNFCHSSWTTCTRPSRAVESVINTGENATFEYWSKVPPKISTYNQKFMPLEEGVAWMSSHEVSLYYKVTHGIYKWSILSQYAYTDESKSTPISVSSLSPGQRVYLGVKAKNTGGTAWTKGVNAPNLGTNAPHDRISAFCDSTWISCTRPASMKETEVYPGSSATYEFWYQVPLDGGSFTEHFKLVIDGYSWLNENAMNFKTAVSNPTTTWKLKSMFAYTDSSKSANVDLKSLSPGQRVFIGFTAKNTGSTYWNRSGNNPIRVGTNAPHDRISAFCDNTWISCTRPALLKEAQVAPGEIGTFEFWYKAPNYSIDTKEHFKLLSEGLYWLNENSLNFHSIVN